MLVAVVVAAVVVEVRLPNAVVNVQLAGAPSQPGSPAAGAAVHVISVFFGNLPGLHKLSPFSSVIFLGLLLPGHVSVR